jgi:hypothetical protein
MWGVFFVKDNKNYIQINDEAYAYNELYYLSFSKDGSKYGWTFLKEPCKDYGEIIGTQCDFYIQINNQTYGPYAGAYGPIFSDDGSKYGWTFVKDKEDYIQINNQTFGPYEIIFDLQLSNDGSKYGWTFGKDCVTYPELATICDKYFIQINNQTYGPYDNEDHTPALRFSNDGSKYGWRFKKDKKWYVQINNQTYGPYDDAYDPIFSNDGSKYGWRFEKDNKYYIQINDKTYGPYDKATFTFTKDNKAYMAYISGNELVIEEVE